MALTIDSIIERPAIDKSGKHTKKMKRNFKLEDLTLVPLKISVNLLYTTFCDIS